MTMGSRRMSLWTRLTERFLLERGMEGNGHVPQVATTVFPVIDAEAPLTDTVVDVSSGIDISAGGGFFVAFHTVPVGQQWTMKWAWREATLGNSQIAISDRDDFIYATEPGTGSEQVSINEVTLRAGQAMGMVTTGNGGDTSRGMRVLYERIDLGV